MKPFRYNWLKSIGRFFSLLSCTDYIYSRYGIWRYDFFGILYRLLKLISNSCNFISNNINHFHYWLNWKDFEEPNDNY